MAGDSEVVILLRVAEKKQKTTNKIKPDWVNNIACLKNLLLNKKKSKVVIFGDNLDESKEATLGLVNLQKDVTYKDTSSHGNSKTFLEVLDYATSLPSDTIVYFLEDDYLHVPGFTDVLIDGLKRAEYVTLYDHPDKYPGSALLFLGEKCHFRHTGSTTMTFATKVKTLAFDAPVFKAYCEKVDIAPDYYIWQHLVVQLKRRLISPIPSFATHGESKWLAPFVNWEDLSK